MKPKWNNPDRDLPQSDPELEALARLYRDHPPMDPSAQTWQTTLTRIQLRLDRPGRGRWRLGLLAGLITTAAAMLGGVVLARHIWLTPTPSPDLGGIVQQTNPEDDEPFPVASLAEVNIIRLDPNDADRVVMGQPLIGLLEFVSTEEIDIVQVDPDPETDRMPFLHRNAGGPMIIIARADEDDEP
jgi:hypothetical protein